MAALPTDARLELEATQMEEPIRRASLTSIPEQKEALPSLSPVLVDSVTESPEFVYPVRGHRHQRSLSPSRRLSVASSTMQSSDMPVFIPTTPSIVTTPGRLVNYYEDSFKARPFATIAKDRVLQMTPVVAELRTNVMIKDEFTVITDLSNELSTRYSRPESSILVTLDHSASIIMGGSFDPTYILTISACPSFLQPVTNMRNAALLQRFLADIIGVPPHRGIVKFVPVPEEGLATDGRTVHEDIEQEESYRGPASDAGSSRPNFFRGLGKTRTRSRHTLGHRSNRSIGPMDSTLSFGQQSSVGVSPTTTPAVPPLPSSALNVLSVPSNKKHSFADSGIGTPTSENNGTPQQRAQKSAEQLPPPPPPPPAEPETPAPKLSKRKSLAAFLRKSRSRPMVAA